MFNNDYNELDPISFWVLLFLSSGQQLSFHDLVKVMERSKENIWDSLQILQNRHYVKNANSKFSIDTKGIEFLNKKGISASLYEANLLKNEIVKTNLFREQFSSLTWIVFTTSIITVIAGIVFFLTQQNESSSFTMFHEYLVIVYCFSIAFIYLLASFHYVPKNEAIVIFNNKKEKIIKGPKYFILFPLFTASSRIDLREHSMEILKETSLTRDNIIVNIECYYSWKIVDPIKCISTISNIEKAILSFTTAVLRASIAEYTLQDALNMRKAINTLIHNRTSEKVTDWGIEIKYIEIHEILPPNNIMSKIQDKFSADLENEVILAKNDAQIETLRRLIAIRPAIDENTINLYNAIFGSSPLKQESSIKDRASETTQEFLSRNEAYDVFHLEITIQNLTFINEFYSETEKVLRSIDFIYTIFAIGLNEKSEAIVDLLAFLENEHAEKITNLSNIDLSDILKKYNLSPLLISSFKYASPVSVDLLGIGTIIEKISDLIKDVVWRGKHERKIAELEVHEKTLQNQKLQIDIVLESIEKIHKMKLSKQQKDLLLAVILPKTEVISKSNINPQFLFTKTVKGKTISDIEDKKQLPY